MRLEEAILKLNPTIKVIRGDVAFDAEGNEVAYDLAQAQALVESNEYKLKREEEYPSFADQFDIIYHQGLDAWKAQIQAVKDKYPKGSA